MQTVIDFEIRALDSATIDFDPVRIGVTSGLTAQTLAVPPSLPAGVSNPRVIWNAGDDDLPGPSH
ncbi:hypothetical protein D3C83_173110 [compost metagenome]